MKVPLLVAAGAASVLLVVWLLVGREEVPRPSIESAPPAPEPVATEIASLATDARSAVAPSPAETKSAHGVIEIRFKDLAHRDVQPNSGRILFHRDGQAVRESELHGSIPFRITDLDAGHYELRARPDGYDEATATVDVLEEPSIVACEICVTPENWVGVVVRDAAGRSIADWSRDWGGSPENFFRGSFRAFLADTMPMSAQTSGGTKLEGQVEAAGTGCTPPGCIGFVARDPNAPVWIGLECLGVFLGWELASPTARSVVFVVDPSAISARFAEVRVRVLHEETRLPALEAKIALLSDSSKHRRKEQQQVTLDRDGVAVLSRLMPEDYELRIELSAPDVASEVVQRLVLAPGEHRDLGDILVRSAPPIRVRVVDEEGQDVGNAAVQVGPLMPGTDEDTVYSVHGQPRYWHADRNGVISIPQPAFHAVMRAVSMRRVHESVLMPDAHGPRSANTTLENRTLVVRNRVRVKLSNEPSLALAAAEIQDELGIVVEKTVLDSMVPWQVDLVRGVYAATARDAQGHELARVSFTVETEPVSIDFR